MVIKTLTQFCKKTLKQFKAKVGKKQLTSFIKSKIRLIV